MSAAAVTNEDPKATIDAHLHGRANFRPLRCPGVACSVSRLCKAVQIRRQSWSHQLVEHAVQVSRRDLDVCVLSLRGPHLCGDDSAAVHVLKVTVGNCDTCAKVTGACVRRPLTSLVAAIILGLDRGNR